MLDEIEDFSEPDEFQETLSVSDAVEILIDCLLLQHEDDPWYLGEAIEMIRLRLRRRCIKPLVN